MSALDTRQLSVFVALVHEQSFTAAARVLHLTQSAVSHSIKGLEGELGCRLVRRSGKKVEPTAAGSRLYREASRLLGDLGRLRAEVEDIGAWGRGRLRISAGASACEFFLPGVLREFRECFPEAPIQIVPADTDEGIELLRLGKVDLALGVEAEEADDLHLHPLFRDELHFTMGAAHPGARKGLSATSRFSQQRFILYNRGSQTFRMVEALFRARGWRLQNYMEMGSMNAIKELVKIGFGIAVLPTWMIEKELEEGLLVSFATGRPPLRRRWMIAWEDERQLTLAEATFVGLCTSAAENLIVENRVHDNLKNGPGTKTLPDVDQGKRTAMAGAEA